MRSGRQHFRRYVLATWLPNHVMEATTREGYTHIVEKYLLGWFGAMRLNQIRPADVRQFLTSIGQEGASVYTVSRCRTVLSAIFTTALNDQLIAVHPCRGVRTPTIPPVTLRIVTPTEVDALVAALPSERWRLLAEVVIASGLRWGELAELRVGDLAPDTGVLTVARTVSEVTRRMAPDGQRFHVNDYPKTKQHRRVSLPTGLVERLQAYVADEHLMAHDLLFPAEPQARPRRRPAPPSGAGMTEPDTHARVDRHGTLTAYAAGRCRCTTCRRAYADYRAARRATGKDRPPVNQPAHLTGSTVTGGRHVSRYWFRERVWYPALATAGIAHRVRIHDLRHAHASWLLLGGADLQIVRERLGHAGLRATERYLHTVPTPADAALDALARVRPTPPTPTTGRGDLEPCTIPRATRPFHRTRTPTTGSTTPTASATTHNRVNAVTRRSNDHAKSRG